MIFADSAHQKAISWIRRSSTVRWQLCLLGRRQTLQVASNTPTCRPPQRSPKLAHKPSSAPGLCTSRRYNMIIGYIIGILFRISFKQAYSINILDYCFSRHNSSMGSIRSIMAYDWTGQRARRAKTLRLLSVALFLILLVGLPAIFLR